MKIEQIEISKITVDRSLFKSLDNEVLDELKDSISAVGLLCPITVNKEFQLVDGHARLEACKILGWMNIDSKVVDASTADIELINLTKSEPRRPLTDEQTKNCLNKVMARNPTLTRQQLADKVGMSTNQIDWLLA